MYFRRLFALSVCLALIACDGEKKGKLTPGERVDVVLAQTHVTPDTSMAGQPVEIPDQANLTRWMSRNDAMLTAHIGLTGLDHHEHGSIGDGHSFSRNEVPTPIVIDDLVVAMDAVGVVSAHSATDIATQMWSTRLEPEDHDDDMLGGGLAAAGDVVFATTGYGQLSALDMKTGKLLWSTRVGAPVRGAPAIAADAKRVIVLTADNQTLAYDSANGEPRWGHRGIRESAGYFSTAAPVVSEGIVITAYSSGEVFALRAETGNPLWSDMVTSSVKTSAASVFSGIDADPIVQDGVVVVTNSTGAMQASALLNGRPLWQQKIGAHTTPWSAGNVLFALSSTHDLVAVFKRNGAVRWAQALAEKDSKDKDVTPSLYGPILAGNAVLVISGEGKLLTFRPQDGQPIGEYTIEGGVASAPVIAGGALYLVTQDATLHKYY